MANPWFKFYAADYLSEIKLKGVSADRRSCLLTALCYSAVNEGVIDTRYLTNDILKMESGVLLGGKAWTDTGDIYEWLVSREIGVMEDYLFSFKNWFTRQESYLTDSERSKRKREKARVSDDTLDKNRVDKNREYFDRVWEVYPKKAGKIAAFKVFEKLNPTEELTQNIISSIERFSKSPQWQDHDGRYIPHPATFLNRESFDDAPVKKGPKIVDWEKTDLGMKPVFEKVL